MQEQPNLLFSKIHYKGETHDIEKKMQFLDTQDLCQPILKEAFAKFYHKPEALSNENGIYSNLALVIASYLDECEFKKIEEFAINGEFIFKTKKGEHTICKNDFRGVGVFQSGEIGLKGNAVNDFFKMAFMEAVNGCLVHKKIKAENIDLGGGENPFGKATFHLERLEKSIDKGFMKYNDDGTPKISDYEVLEKFTLEYKEGTFFELAKFRETIEKIYKEGKITQEDIEVISQFISINGEPLTVPLYIKYFHFATVSFLSILTYIILDFSDLSLVKASLEIQEKKREEMEKAEAEKIKENIDKINAVENQEEA